MGVSNLFVCLMGMGVVFIGLICLVIICSLLRAVCYRPKKQEESAEAAPAPVSAPAVPEIPAAERQQLLAAVCN